MTVEVSIKKISEREGRERFVLIDPKSRDVLTTSDVSEGALRRFLRKRGADDELIDQCLERARQRYKPAGDAEPTGDDADAEDNDLLFELGLGGQE